MLKIKKKYFFYSFPLFFLFPYFSLFSHTTGQKSANLIAETDSTAQFTLFGRQPLKPLGSEVTHPPWPPSVHITNHHHHLHITLFYTNHYILHTGQPLNTLNHMDMHNACGVVLLNVEN